MKHVDLSPYQYIGADIAGELIRLNRLALPELQFAVLDVCDDKLPSVDFILSRDLLVHLCFVDAALALENIRASSIRYLGATTFTEIDRNKDKLTGNHHRLNMLKPPFSWGALLYLLPHGAQGEPMLRPAYLPEQTVALRTRDVCRIHAQPILQHRGVVFTEITDPLVVVAGRLVKVDRQTVYPGLP